MPKKEHPEIARIRRFQESLDPYSEPSEDFPKDFGVVCYNKEFDSLGDYFFPQEMPRAKAILLRDYSVFKRMTDKAIKGEKPTDEDNRILQRVFPSEYEVKGVEGKNRWFPAFSPKSSERALPFVDLLFGWVYYVWREQIDV